MTGVQTRDLGYISWTDPDAWMENMSGSAWKKLVQEENAAASRWLHADPAVVSAALSYRNGSRPAYQVAAGKIQLTPTTGFLYRGRIGARDIEVFDLDAAIAKNVYVYSYDIGNGAEHCRLQAVDAEGHKLWHKDGISEQCAVVGDRVYYLRVRKRLWAHELCSCDFDGSNERIHYKEVDGRWNLTLFKGPARKLFIVRENSGTLEGSLVDRITFKPVESPWSLIGIEDPGIESAGGSFRVTRSFGERTLWKNNKRVFSIKGHIWFDHFQVWEGARAPSIFVDAPNMAVTRWEPGFKPVYHSKLLYSWAKSATDGTRVPFIVVSRDGAKPKKLLVIGYGAYGMPTSLHDLNTRWGVFLDSGFAVALALIRGGGDHDSAWHKAAQRDGRWRAFDDFEACIGASQAATGIGAAGTIIYGRSAGGFLVGAVLNRNPTAKLFRGVYTEVPYVDVLRTTTNPSLPLTVMEYDEFGSPGERVSDFLFLLENSPTNAIPSGGAPNVAVLARTAENDSEVYAYEPVKWIRRLRAGGGTAPKIVRVAEGEGHFAPEEVIARDIAEDLGWALMV